MIVIMIVIMIVTYSRMVIVILLVMTMENYLELLDEHWVAPASCPLGLLARRSNDLGEMLNVTLIASLYYAHRLHS